MTSVQEEKQKLRDKVLAKRQQLSEQQWLNKSNQIIQSLVDSDVYKKSGVIHTYVSMNERREVCTDNLLIHLFDDKKRVVVPITNFSDNTLSHSEIDAENELVANNWGVREPKTINPVEISEIDLIIVPMAAADKDGNRLGYGRGFYDRFLDMTEATKIGLTFDKFLFDKVPVEEFDVKLDVIITEEVVIFT
ncbi:MAG: 5-formyltetrahydrofolate cyclo-ligase [Gracilimonas sp.]|uniref:5-formyltetrahydrofolate cyclo-ligase n=1 Tax=Gracilimonas sp. TaxID=1974203 RepID=UPI001985DC03|nr:5-formyltetrahydrofolate cyclo-ligase [Gracilimonas sp.]MBD3615815.1 5-formyltetrahydrofolate cyclo-ligase [Gracilimonas sp.]